MKRAHRKVPTRAALGFILILSGAQVGFASADLCDRAAQAASDATGVPARILWAITRTETGRTLDGEVQPWPWVANVSGEGIWFDSAQATHSHLSRLIADGHQDFDVGCFQINYRWHASGFSNLSEMLDPSSNAFYAADFLLNLHAEFGNWDAAVGAYHSRTSAHASRYLRQFLVHYALLEIPPADFNFDEGSELTPVQTGLSFSARPSLYEGHSVSSIHAVNARNFLTRLARPIWEAN